MGVLNALRKGVASAAGAAVPMLMEEHKAQILAERDARLRSFDKEDQAADRKYRTDERIAGNTFTMEENDRQRKLTREENAADREQRGNEFDVTSGIQEEGLALDRERLDIAIKQAEQALEIGGFEIHKQEQIQSLMDLAIDENASPEDRLQATEQLETLTGEGGNNFESFTTGGGIDDATGNAVPRNTGILNRRRGSYEFVTPPGNGGSSTGSYDTPEAIREALRSGAIDRTRAVQLLDQFAQ